MIKKIITPTIKKRMLFFLINDMMISFFTFYLSYLLRFNFDIPLSWFDNFLLLFGILFLFKATSFFLFNIYSTPWRFFALDSFKQIVLAHIVSYTVFALFFWMTFGLLGAIPRSVLVIDLFLSIFFIGSLRVAKRIFIESSNSSGLATLIIGADSNGELAARYLMSQKSEFYPVAFVDSDENKISSRIHGIKVHDYKNMQNIIKKMDIEAAIISEKLPAKKMNELFDELKSCGIEKIKLMQFFESNSSKELKDISIEDLLAREPKDLDKNVIKNFIKDKTVLVTGAGGSIGSEICRQAADYGAKKIIMVDNSEFNLYQITEELQSFNIASKLNSVLQKEKLDEIFANEKPDIVLHAAAYKHVPMVEENIECALENNIQGTINIIDLSIKHGVGTFILISTDKAVRPTNVMGTTKRVCELYAMSVPPQNTKIAAVRFGNVLGSSGSVIPKFKEQIKKGGPLTVTHPEISRYFMLISEACELVLQAATLATNKEIFILDMGEPIKISELAKKMLLLADREDIKIEYTGLRKGEKLYEELLIDENDKETKYSSIFIAKPEQVEYQEIKNKIQKIFSSKDKIKALQEMVPEFIHKRDNDK